MKITFCGQTREHPPHVLRDERCSGRLRFDAPDPLKRRIERFAEAARRKPDFKVFRDRDA